MTAQYLFRLDDITPTMDLGRFEAVVNLLFKHSVKPLLGIVPDNRDATLNRQSSDPRFWDKMRSLQERGAIDIAQHGYQHLLTPRPGISLLRVRGRKVSEFAGEPYQDQVFKITEGNRILRTHGIYTCYWMAPNHSFDDTTVRALVDTGFTAISDGISLFPYSYGGLIFIPQQTWQPRWMPCGVQTICLHTNSIRVSDIKKIRAFLREPHAVTSFSEVVNTYSHNRAHRAADLAFQAVYHATWKLTKRSSLPFQAVRQLPQRATQLGSKPPQPSHLGS